MSEEHQKRMMLDIAGGEKPVAAHEPVFFVSPGQLPSIKDSGYWPYRKQMEGLFTLPLYASVSPCARCEEAEQIEAEATAKLGEEIIKNGVLQDKLAKQEAENEWLNRENNELGARIGKEINIELTDLRARCEKAEKDAARYRWLRSNERGMANLTHIINDACSPPYFELKCTEELDAAIDAAIAKEKWYLLVISNLIKQSPPSEGFFFGESK